MREIFPDYELTEDHFMEVIKDRISKLKIKNGELKTGNGFEDPAEKEKDCKGRSKHYIALNGKDTPRQQAVSLVHEAIHIDISERFWEQPMYGTFIEMRSDEERLVASRTEKFLGENLSLALAGLYFTKMKHGNGIQIPLIPESMLPTTA